MFDTVFGTYRPAAVVYDTVDSAEALHACVPLQQAA